MDNQAPAFKRSIGLVEADVEANCVKHGVRGILQHEDILRMIAEYDEDDKQARIFGKFQHLTGLVFKNFTPRVHVIRPFDLDPRDWVVVEALDPHPRNRDAVVWMAIDKYGRKIVVDEIYQNFNGVEELSRAIQDKAVRYRIEKRVIDPSAEIIDQHTGRSLRSDLYNVSRGVLDYDLGSKQRHMATQLIKNAFSFQEQNDQFLKYPELYIFDSCVRSIWEVQHWQYEEWSGKTASRRNPNEKPMDKDDHCIECIGRCLLANVTYAPMQAVHTNYYGNQAVLDNAPAPRNLDDPYN